MYRRGAATLYSTTVQSGGPQAARDEFERWHSADEEIVRIEEVDDMGNVKTVNGTYENWSGARRSAMARIRMALEAARKLSQRER